MHHQNLKNPPVKRSKQPIERLNELLDYNPETGKVTIKKSGRTLTADTDGLVVIFDSKSCPKVRKHKLERIAYFLAFSVAPREDQRVLHKNLDSEDNRMQNLTLVSRSVFRQIKEAHRNLTGGIHLVPHATDQFSYILKWFEDGLEKSKIIQDIVVARRQQLKLQLKYSKILTKFCLFDN